MNFEPILIICGPTATGKTSFALDLCRKINGEILSADSRQVYKQMDLVTGKDVPPGQYLIDSNIRWRDRTLGHYDIGGVAVWLYDIVSPDEPFNVSFWHEAASLLINDIQSRDKIPVVVGGTGLYIKSLVSPIDTITSPPNYLLRDKLKQKNPQELMKILDKLDSAKAASLNVSDRQNPRRLVRAIELGMDADSPKSRGEVPFPSLQLGLTAPLPFLKQRIVRRVEERIAAGALEESRLLMSRYGYDFPSMSASGYKAFQYEDWKEKWITLENQYLKRQLTWFKKQPDIRWFDISLPDWETTAQTFVLDWYNKIHDPES
jgi:tRNA dimethylallyltransferase